MNTSNGWLLTHPFRFRRFAIASFFGLRKSMKEQEHGPADQQAVGDIEVWPGKIAVSEQYPVSDLLDIRDGVSVGKDSRPQT